MVSIKEHQEKVNTPARFADLNTVVPNKINTEKENKEKKNPIENADAMHVVE